MTTTGTTWDNLKLSLAGATEMTRNIIAHESHEGNEGTGVLQNAPTRRLTPESINAFILLWIEAAFTHILPLKTIHTRHWRGLLADLQMVICYGLGARTQHW